MSAKTANPRRGVFFGNIGFLTFSFDIPFIFLVFSGFPGFNFRMGMRIVMQKQLLLGGYNWEW